MPRTRSTNSFSEDWRPRKEVMKDINRRRDARDIYGPGGSPTGSGRGQAQRNARPDRPSYGPGGNPDGSGRGQAQQGVRSDIKLPTFQRIPKRIYNPKKGTIE